MNEIKKNVKSRDSFAIIHFLNFDPFPFRLLHRDNVIWREKLVVFLGLDEINKILCVGAQRVLFLKLTN